MMTQAYILRCLSPLHVGSGDTNYGVIDNLVQREDHTGLPCINGSSLKGALREYFEPNENQTRIDAKVVHRIFGAPISKGGAQLSNNLQAGEVAFDMGLVLSLPVRSDLTPYLCATTPALIQQLEERLRLLGAPQAGAFKQVFEPLLGFGKVNPLATAMVIEERLKDGPLLEEDDFKASYLELGKPERYERIIGDPLVVMPHEQFATVARDLPVIARNQLENGESKNLWYEEIVPREARFFTLITGPDDLVKAFDAAVANQVIQLGANASIGYGRTLFLPLQTLLA